MAFSLPPHWRTVTLKEVASDIPNAIVDGPFGSNLKTDDYVESGIPVLQGKNITNDTFKWFDVRYITEKKADGLKRSSVRPHDILVVKIGSIGYSAVVDCLDGHEFAIIPANLVKVTPNPEVISTKYLHKWLTSPDAKRYLVANASKTAQPALSLGKIKELPVPLPPLSEQHRIATILDQADALRTKRRESLAQLDSLTQSIFIEMFGDPVTNPRGIKVVHLSEITTRVTDGIHQKPNYTEEGVPFISVKDITSGVLKFDKCKFISFDDHKKFTKRCKAEYLDILYTKVGATYGRPALVDTDKEFSLYVSVCLIKPERKLVDPFFLNAALGTAAIKSQADRKIKGIGVPDLHLDQIQKLLIPLPTMEKQREFSERVASVEILKSTHLIALTNIDKLFASLQHRAFRGEL